MQLTITTDYAIRTILYLSESERKASADEIAEAMEIPKGYLEKVLKKLKEDGYVASELGRGGGYFLEKQPEEITLGDLIRTMEYTVKINRCLEEDHYCNRDAAEACIVRKFYLRVQEKLEKEIFRITIADLMKDEA